MKFRKIQVLSLLCIGIFFISGSGGVNPAEGETGVQTNFDLWFFTGSGSRILESTSLYFKQALAPLGIDVKIVAKPFGQFVGDLFHESTGHPFDLAEIRFTGGVPTPEFNWAYHTEGSFGCDMWQLCDEDWKAWQEIDTGIKQDEIDDMVDEIRFELNTTRRKEITTAFVKLFYEKLLYDFPTTSSAGVTSFWRGFGGPQNELWDVDEGYRASSYMGAYWEYNPSIRAAVSNTTTFRDDLGKPNKPGNFDPMQSFDSETTLQTSSSSDTLLRYDKNNNPHPSIAYQWLKEDYTNGTGYLVESGKHTFFLRDNATWQATTDWEGNVIPAEIVDANDFLFTLEILTNFSEEVVVNGLESFTAVDYAKVKTTVTTDDTIEIYIKDGKVTIDDVIVYGGYNPPMPAHILGGTLHFQNATTDVWTNGTAQALVDAGINPQLSKEWAHWTSQDGTSLAGPYELTKHVADETVQFNARSDYYFPNEWDVVGYHATDVAGAGNFAANYPDYDMSIFAPHLYNTRQDAYYFAFNGTEANMQKPSHLAIDSLIYTRVDDTNARLLLFEAGQLDAFASSALGAQQVKTHTDNPEMVQRKPVPSRGPEFFVFNLLNPHLKKYEVRKAITSAIDKNVLLKIWDNFALVHESIVWANSPGYYSISTQFTIPYSYDTARDLMRKNGYDAADSNEPDTGDIDIPVKPVVSTIQGEVSEVVEEITEALGSEIWIGITGFAVLAVSLIRRRKRV